VADVAQSILDEQKATENETVTTLVRDGRALAGSAADPAHELLEGSGYVLMPHTSAVTDWYDEEDVSAHYYKEAGELVKSIFPTAQVFPTTGGHIMRDEKPLVRDAAFQAPARAVHNDFAPSYVNNFKRNEQLKMALDHGARLVCLNLWRSVSDEPMARMPLAVCDRRSIARADVQSVPLGDVGGGDAGGDGQGYQHEIMIASHSDEHEWVYFPKLTKEEVMVFVTFDSGPGDDFVPTLHTAIDLPGTEGLAGRESCEIRVNALVMPEEMAKMADAARRAKM